MFCLDLIILVTKNSVLALMSERLALSYLLRHFYANSDMEHKTTIAITKKPGPMSILIETTSFNIDIAGSTAKAEGMVDYSDDTVNLYVVVKGQPGQELELKLTLNKIPKELKVPLYKSGLNEFRRSYPYSDFFGANV